MEATRHLVTTGAEFAPGMQNGEHRLQSALAGAGVNIRRDAAAVVADRSGAVLSQNHHDLIAVACQSLIH